MRARNQTYIPLFLLNKFNCYRAPLYQFNVANNTIILQLIIQFLNYPTQPSNLLTLRKIHCLFKDRKIKEDSAAEYSVTEPLPPINYGGNNER